MQKIDGNYRSRRRPSADVATDDLDRRLIEAITRLERVRSKALNAVGTMIAGS